MAWQRPKRPKQAHTCLLYTSHVYVVTLSGKLSGSYNSAVLAVNLYNEEHDDCGKQIYVFNSRSASIGETLIGMKVQELEESGLCLLYTSRCV